MTAAEVAEILRRLHGAYRTEITEDLARVWVNTFHDADFARMATATDVWIREQSEFPTPADMRATMRATSEPARMALPRPTQRIVPFPEGIQVAYEAYCHERQRQGRPAMSYEQFRGSAWMRRMADQEEANRGQ